MTAMNQETYKKKINRVMIAAGSSSSGKTMISCGLLEALKKRGLGLNAYKCGPDYIDPMFHSTVLGIDSENLDSYLSDRDGIRQVIASAKKDNAVIEGVMGIYDGMSVDSIKASCYDVASLTDTPIILVIDASNAGRTVISHIKGILADDSNRMIKGIILNRISEGFYEKLKPVILKELTDGGFSDIRLIGGIPKLKDICIESRYLGLKLPSEIDNVRENIDKFSEILEKRCDIDSVIDIMNSADEIEYHSDVMSTTKAPKDKPVIAVARDEAFCFYYRENLRLLERAGAKLAYFSPLHDTEIPKEACGLILGGGYPELYLDKLSSNTSMLRSVKQAIDSGMPTIAECGGYMYLHSLVKDREGKAFSLVGAVDGECSYTGHLVRFGYMQVCDDIEEIKAFGADIRGMRGHEFHYYDSTVTCDHPVKKPVSKTEWNGIICDEKKLWGYPHFYYGSCIKIVNGFTEAAKDYSNGKQCKVFCQ